MERYMKGRYFVLELNNKHCDNGEGSASLTKDMCTYKIQFQQFYL